jgi:hypothetical protein
VHDGHPRRLEQCAGRSEAGAAEIDVIGLPVAGRAHGVGERRELAVERRRLAVGVGLVVVEIQDLDLVALHQEHAAVAASLAVALDLGRRRPLDVQLHVAEALPRPDVAGARLDHEGAVLDPPLRGSVIDRLPGRQIGAVEQDDGIRGHGRRQRLRRRGHHVRARPSHVVRAPFGLRQGEGTDEADRRRERAALPDFAEPRHGRYSPDLPACPDLPA